MRRRAFRPSPTTTSTDAIESGGVMDAWRVVLVVNLALAVGLGVGYVGWGRRVDALDRELDATRARVERLERERQARATGGPGGGQQWGARGDGRAGFSPADTL